MNKYFNEQKFRNLVGLTPEQEALYFDLIVSKRTLGLGQTLPFVAYDAPDTAAKLFAAAFDIADEGREYTRSTLAFMPEVREFRLTLRGAAPDNSTIKNNYKLLADHRPDLAYAFMMEALDAIHSVDSFGSAVHGPKRIRNQFAEDVLENLGELYRDRFMMQHIAPSMQVWSECDLGVIAAVRHIDSSGVKERTPNGCMKREYEARKCFSPNKIPTRAL
jgi:hypothetical protein